MIPDDINPLLQELNSAPIKHSVKLNGILLRPNVTMSRLAEVLPYVEEFLENVPEDIKYSAEVNIKYSGYIQKEREMVEKMNRLEEVKLKDSFDYHQIKSLSNEAREKLSQLRPRTIGQASRISGVSPSDISVLLVHMGR